MSSSHKIRKVSIVTRGIVNKPCYKRRLWIAARNMNIPWCDWIDVIADAINNFDGVILACSGGILWPIPEVKKVFNDPRWFFHYLETLNDDPRWDIMILQRIQLIDLYFKISKPAIARHFNK